MYSEDKKSKKMRSPDGKGRSMMKSESMFDKRASSTSSRHKVSHDHVKDMPMPGSGKSIMQKPEKGSNEVYGVGCKKFGSNMMSPVAYEGRVNEYSNGRDNHK